MFLVLLIIRDGQLQPLAQINLRLPAQLPFDLTVVGVEVADVNVLALRREGD